MSVCWVPCARDLPVTPRAAARHRLVEQVAGVHRDETTGDAVMERHRRDRGVDLAEVGDDRARGEPRQRHRAHRLLDDARAHRHEVRPRRDAGGPDHRRRRPRRGRRSPGGPSRSGSARPSMFSVKSTRSPSRSRCVPASQAPLRTRHDPSVTIVSTLPSRCSTEICAITPGCAGRMALGRAVPAVEQPDRVRRARPQQPR